MSRTAASQFALEELEPRVLLSANLATVATGSALFAQQHHTQVIHETGPSHVSDSHLGFQGSGAAENIFDGIEQASQPASAPSQDTSADQPTGSPEVQQAAQTAPVAHKKSTKVSTEPASNLSQTSVDSTGVKAQELTQTLKGANAPPSAQPTSSHAQPRTPAAIQDLQTYIQDLLASYSASFTTTEQLGTVSLGGFLQLTDVTLVITATLTNGTWSGNVSISATSATLFPGKTFSASITSQNASPAITGSYSIGHGYSLNVASTATMTLTIGEALKITATGVSLSYDPNGAGNQNIATITTASVTSNQFDSMGSVTLQNFKVRTDGFSFDAFTLSSAQGSDPSIGTFLKTSGVTLSVTDFNVSFGFGNNAAAMTGTVGITVSGLELFPNGSLVQFHADSVSASYSFAAFNGTTPTGELSVTVTGLKLSLGPALDITAANNVTFSPGQTVMATVDTATISSPSFTGLGTITVTDLQISQTGFSLGSAVWTSPGSVSIGDFVQIGGLSVTLSNVELQYGDGSAPQIGGSITLSATAVVLFPNIPLLNLHLGTISGSFNFGSSLSLPSGFLSLHIPTFDIPLGDALTLHLGDVDLTPGIANMLHVPDVNLSTNLFSGVPDFDLGAFDLTQNGFTLGTFKIIVPTTVKIGDFVQFSNFEMDVDGFTIDKRATPIISGSITLKLGSMTLFPDNGIVTSTFTNVVGSYSFSGTTPGQLSFTADTMSLTIAGQLTLTANTITITPTLDTIATIQTATLTFAPLEDVHLDVTGLEFRKNGFTIASASVQLGSNVNLGAGSSGQGILSLQTPTLSLTNLDYTMGAGLSGTVGFSTTNAQLHLGNALNTSASSLTADYNLATKELTATVASFGLSLGGFATLSASGATLTYSPTDNETSEMTLGMTGVDAFLGAGTGLNRVGIHVGNGSLALAIFKAIDGTITYALDAKGHVELLGMPSNTLSLAGGIEFRKNTAGTVSRVIQAGDDQIRLDFNANEQSAFATGLTLTVGTFVTVTGDFGFQQFTDAGGTEIAIGAKNVSATMAAGSASVTVDGASLGLFIKPGATAAQTTYALIANGGTDSLNGVPGLTLTASGLLVRVRRGLDASTLSNLPSVATPDGDVTLNFANLGTGSSSVTDLEGNVTLSVAGFVTVSGNFGFQQFTDGNGTSIAVGARDLSIVLGTATTNLTLNNATFGVIIKPGANGAPTRYALEAQGSSLAADTSLNGVPNVTLNATNLLVRVRKGLDISSDVSGVPTSIQTSGGAVTLDFSGLGAGSTDVTDIEGSVTLSVDGFGSIHGDFGFQSYVNGSTGEKEIAIGARNLSIVLGTATTNLTIANATFGMIIRPGLNGAPTTYALEAQGSSDPLDTALNGVPGLTVNASNLLVRIRKGLDVTTSSGEPGTIHTSGGDVTLDFSDLAGTTSDFADVEGTVTIDVGGFVSVTGDFGFQSYTDGTNHYLEIGATNLTVTLTAGSVSLSLSNATIGVIVKQGSPSTYVLEAHGSADVADTTFSGLNGFSISATDLSVRVRRGLDISAIPSSVPTAVHTPGGDITFDFTGLSGGTSDITDIEGHLSLNVSGFASLEGDFGIQKFTDGQVSDVAIGARNINLVLGTSTTNLTIQNASLAMLIKPGVGYALVATAGTSTLNGVPDLSVSTTGLMVRIRSGLNPSSISSAPTSVQTPGGSVSLNFTGLGTTDVTEVSGSISVTVANFITVSGQFSFTKSVIGNVTKILVSATGVNAFIGTADQSMGVSINGAQLGLVIYKDSTKTASTYAMQASASSITIAGLGDLNITGGPMTLAINTTGAAVHETNPVINFNNGDNIKSFGGHLSVALGSTFSLSGDFSFTQVTNGTLTKLIVGVANVNSNGPVGADGTSDTFNLSNGTLGIVFYKDGNTSLGYAMTASATATVAVGTALTGTATLTIRRNTTTTLHDETITVGASTIKVTFVNNEKTINGNVFQSIALSNASITIDNTLIITAASATSTNPLSGVSSTPLTGVTLTLQDPNTLNVLFNISADGATYTAYSTTVTANQATGAGLTARADGNSWQAGDKDLLLTNVSFSIGSFVTFTANTIELQHYTGNNGVVNSFKFNGAAITFYSNGQALVRLTGSPTFHFGGTDGFKMDSFTNPGFAFLGGIPGLGNRPLTTNTVSLGPITLANPSLSVDNFKFAFGQGGTGDLTATIHFLASSATIGADTNPLHAAITNLDAHFNLTAGINLSNPLSLPTITANGFAVQADHFLIQIGSFLTIEAGTAQNPLIINPSATATQDLVNFGTLTATLTMGSVTLSGSASNFAIEGDGSFLAKTNFSVSITIGQDNDGNADTSGLSWPSWLPLKSVTVGLVWTNFNVDPTKFLIQLSATVDLSSLKGVPFTVSGSITDLVIDPSLISQGKFPVISIGSFLINVHGNLFGGTVDGTLFLAILRFDANGAIIDGLGNVQGTNTPATGEITNVLYGGIEASFKMGSLTGFAIRIGLSQYGPLQLYVEVGAPIALGSTGLFLSDFRGGVQFNATFPTITITGQASDALQLRQSGFTPQDALTPEQWEAQLRTQVKAQYLSGATDGWSNLGAAHMIITAGATLYEANPNVFRVDADIYFDTTGKFLVIGTATIGNSLSIGMKFYTDLSTLFTSPNPSQVSLTVLFLMEVPSQNAPNPITAPIYSFYGTVTFSYNTSTQIFQITIAGAAELDVLGGLQAKLVATLTLTFTPTSFTIELSNADFYIPTLTDSRLASAAGKLTIENANGTANIWGAFLLTIPQTGGLNSFLQPYGMSVSGTLYVQLNTTSVVKSVTLQLNGGSTTLSLAAQTFEIFINGDASFSISGQQVFDVHGTLDLIINQQSFTLFINATLKLGPNTNSPIMTFNANGLIVIQYSQGTDAVGNTINTGFAAKITLTTGLSISGVSFSMAWVLVINTTGSDITYLIPAAVAGGPSVPTVMGPDFSNTSNALATVSYETTVNGHRALVIPRGPPGEFLSTYATWTPTSTAAYFIVVGRGNLTVGGFTITGSINILAAVSGNSITFKLSVNASMNLQVSGHTLFTFTVQGGMIISNAGVVAAVNLTLSAGLPSSVGFSLTGTFQLQLNTTNATAPVQVGNQNINVAPGVLVYAHGDLKIFGNVIDIKGSFWLQITSGSFRIQIDATVTFLGFAKFTVSGFAGVYYDSHPGLALRISLGLGGADGIAPVSALGSLFTIKGTFTLELNTCSVARNDFNGNSIASGVKIAITNLVVYLFGFNCTGSLTISVTSAGVSISIPHLSLDVFGIVTISLSGQYNPDGSFYFIGSAGFTLGNHVFGIGGTLTIGIYHNWAVTILGHTTYLNGFTASVSGWAAAFGIEIDISGSLTILNGSVDISVSMDVHTFLGDVHLGTAHYHFGDTAPPPNVTQSFPPDPTPTPPPVAIVSGGVLTLYVGTDAHLRVDSTGAVTNEQTTENYVITVLGAGSTQGQHLQIVALGYTQDFDNVTSILVTNTDTSSCIINISSAVTASVTMTLGSGSNTITTGSGTANITVNGSGSNQITTAGNSTVTVSSGANGGNRINVGSASTITINGSGSNQIYTIGTGTVTINGTGNNGVAANSGFSGTITIGSGASGQDSISVTGGTPTINVNGGGNDIISVNSSSSRTISISGGGNNNITSIGTGATSLTISGNGANDVSIGAGTATITVTGNGNNSLATGGGAATVTLRGSGNNSVIGNAGFVTVNDQGVGANYVRGGSGGGIYIGGLNSSSQPFITKGTSTVTTTYSNFTVQMSGYANYTLSDSALVYGSFTLNLSGVRTVTLNAPSTSSAHVFTLNGWSGNATLNGFGSNNTMNFTASATSNLNFTLTNSALTVTGGLTQTITLSTIQTANLTGSNAGPNTFTVSAWTGNGSLTSPAGSTGSLIATNDTNFNLSDTSFSRTGFGTLALSGIQFATLTGGASANTFTVTNWTGGANLDGAAANDTYNLTLPGSGTGIINVTDTGSTTNDLLNINAGRTVFVTGTQVRVGTQRVNYGGVEILNVNGSTFGLIYNVQSTAVGVTTTIHTGTGTNIINVGSTAGIVPTTPGVVSTIAGTLNVVGNGSDVMNVDDTGSTNDKSGTLTPTSLTGLNMGANGGISYQGLAELNINLGSGANNFTINDINAATHTTVRAGVSSNDVVTVNAAVDFNGRLDLTGFEHGTVSITANFNGIMTDFGPGHIESVQIGGSMTATGVLSAGSIDTMNVAQNLAGVVTVSGTLSTLTVGNDVSGSVTESGTIDLLTIGGSLTSPGSITAFNAADPAEDPIALTTLGNIVTMTVGHDLAGHVIVSGTFVSLAVGNNLSGVVAVQGQFMQLQVNGDISGSVTESGTMNSVVVGGSITVTGNITAFNTADPVGMIANITSLTVGVDLAGTVLVSGTLNTLSVGHDLSGSLTEAGTITQLTVGNDLSGSVTASNPTATTANIVTLNVGHNLSGAVLVSGTLTTLTVGNDLSGSVIESGTIDLITIGGSFTQTGLIKAVNAVPSLGNINTMIVTQDFAGTLIVSGTLHTLSIVNGSMTPTGVINVGNLDTFTIGPDHLSVGQNMAGQITVSGTLQYLRVAGGTPGSITAGHIGRIAVYGGYGPVVLNVIENGIQRFVQAALPNQPYPMPDPTALAGGPGHSTYVNFQFLYESGALANPQLTVRVTNNVSTARDQFDFCLITYNDRAKFNLARLDAVGVSGIRNVSVEGDLLTRVSAEAIAFIGGANNPAGIRLPNDAIAGVGIRDYAPNGYILAQSIQAIAFGSHSRINGTIGTGATATLNDAALLLAGGTAIVQANDTFRVPFADLSTQQVGLFISTSGRHFDPFNVILTVQNVTLLNTNGNGNITIASNSARGAAIALVTVTPTYGKNGQLRASVIQSIDIRGDGASITTRQWIANSITSSGSLGDVTLLSPLGITNVTAASIFGSIISGGQITGTIQTTGVRIDPTNGATSNVSADLGRVYLLNGRITVTTIQAHGNGAISGRIISRGNLISQIIASGGISGVIAAQNNLGIIVNVGTKTLRYGGIICYGQFSGSLVVLGNEIGDVVITGGLRGGRMAIAGDILGNLSIAGGLDATAALVCGGQIGNTTTGTRLNLSGANKGIVAAEGSIVLGVRPSIRGVFLQNVGAVSGNSDAQAIDAIFTDHNAPLGFDSTGLDLHGLTLILRDLRSLRTTASGHLTGPTA